VRTILEGLAARYRQVLESLETLVGQRVKVIHIVGGGSRNQVLNQFVADSTGRKVIAGPTEATAIGNILVQAMASGALIRRGGLEDTIGFSIGKIPTTLPPEIVAGHFEGLGFDYSNEMYTGSLKLDGLSRRLDASLGPARYLQVSFAFLTKGFGYAPPIPSRYQEIGFEVGLNFPAILRGVGVSNETWWGDLLLRTFTFLRIPYTQVGAYYNLKNHRWYGPGAPYHYE